MVTGFIWILRFAELATPLSQLLEEVPKASSVLLTSEPKTAFHPNTQEYAYLSL